MGTGWRRAFCTTIPRDREITMILEDEAEGERKGEQQKESSRGSAPPRGGSNFSFSSSGSNTSAPKLQSNSPKLSCKTNANNSANSPKLSCKTATTPKSSSKSPRTNLGSNPSSPRSPFSILKNSLRLSRSGCGVCVKKVKTGQGMAVYTAECSHTFHFPCIVEFLKKQDTLICPLCKSPWKDVTLLTFHKLQHNPKQEEKVIHLDSETAAKFHEQSLSFQSLKSKQENPPFIKRADPKTYSDDEPFISPKFSPIPEENEEQEADGSDADGEFQGFFVNSTPRDDDAFADANKAFRDVEVSLLPESSIVAVGRTHETVALVMKIKAPPSGAHNSNSARRSPVDLVAVLDVSGSMTGAKLQMLKKAMHLVISSLGSADRLSIVSFSANPKRLIPLRIMNPQGRRVARRIIDRLVCSQGTSVNEALRKASKILEDRRERNPVASIILLSNGQEERQRSTHVSRTRFSHIEIPVHSSGLGEKDIYTKDPPGHPFSKYVGGLLNVVVQDLRLQLSLTFGSSPAEIVAVYSCNGHPTSLNSDFIQVGDLYAEEEKEFLIELRVPKSTVGSHRVLSIRSSYKNTTTPKLIHSSEHALLIPMPPQAVRSTLPRNERLRGLFIFTRAIALSRLLIQHNELSKAMQLLSSARTLLMQSKCDSAQDHVNSLEVELTEVRCRMQCQPQEMDRVKITRRRIKDQGVTLFMDENGQPLTPTSAWKLAEILANVAMTKKSFSRVSDLHGLENARF